jgi:transcriptional regulator with XRE-family HTH domain
MVNEIIKDLRIVREQKGITYQQIADITEANGEAVSLSTIKKVFGGEYNHNHSYEHTIRPIARALEAEDKKVGDIDYQLLVARLELKDTILQQQEEIIKALKTRLERKDSRHKDREALYLEQIDFYKDQIRFKDEQIRRYQANIDRKDAMLRKLLAEEENSTT